MIEKKQGGGKYQGLSDSDLWTLVAGSDLEALSFVYQKYYDNLFYFGLRCSQDEELVEDCIQDLFIKLWEKRTRIQIKLTIKSYLISAIRRIIIDKLTARKKRLAKDGEFPDGHEPALSVQDLMIDKELDDDRRQQVQQALSQLTKKQKEVIYLRFYQDMSYDEIAETLHVKNQSIRNCIYEAMKLMKNALLACAVLISQLDQWF